MTPIIGWALIVLGSVLLVVWIVIIRGLRHQVEQKDYALSLWRGESKRLRARLAVTQRENYQLRAKLPKRDMNGRFAK